MQGAPFRSGRELREQRLRAWLAPGTPNSPDRTALIDDFRKRSEGLPEKFEARTHESDWTMPYRLFVRPQAENCRWSSS